MSKIIEKVNVYEPIENLIALTFNFRYANPPKCRGVSPSPHTYGYNKCCFCKLVLCCFHWRGSCVNCNICSNISSQPQFSLFHVAEADEMK